MLCFLRHSSCLQWRHRLYVPLGHLVAPTPSTLFIAAESTGGRGRTLMTPLSARRAYDIYDVYVLYRVVN